MKITTHQNLAGFSESLKKYIADISVVETPSKTYHPFIFWKENKKDRHPFLSLVAVEAMGISASSGQLERIFSRADIDSKKRN